MIRGLPLPVYLIDAIRKYNSCSNCQGNASNVNIVSTVKLVYITAHSLCWRYKVFDLCKLNLHLRQVSQHMQSVDFSWYFVWSSNVHDAYHYSSPFYKEKALEWNNRNSFHCLISWNLPQIWHQWSAFYFMTKKTISILLL